VVDQRKTFLSIMGRACRLNTWTRSYSPVCRGTGIGIFEMSMFHSGRSKTGCGLSALEMLRDNKLEAQRLSERASIWHMFERDLLS
jgi:hypothetical protein